MYIYKLTKRLSTILAIKLSVFHEINVDMD